mmetsp:Transcript_31088/g.27364  ORF Transcript_31088/g.27364 Transcript_31088/m.27364 type:complete len:84 (-) Transcript_31088:14-265(-)
MGDVDIELSLQQIEVEVEHNEQDINIRDLLNPEPMEIKIQSGFYNSDRNEPSPAEMMAASVNKREALLKKLKQKKEKKKETII